jgi:hypothetical protein
MALRDEKGHFVKGHPSITPGRPKKSREERYYRITMMTCTFEDWKEIVERAVKDAKKGDAPARRWLSEYLVGVPEQPLSGGIEILVRYVDKADD